MRIILITTLLLLAATACVEEFDPQVDRYENALVIDGLITNEPGPYSVRLTRTYPVGEKYPEPEKGAQVILSSVSGQQETLTEIYSGLYVTSAEGIRGQPGERYFLYIKTLAGREYRSDTIEIKAPAVIDKVYYEFQQEDDQAYTEKGVRIYVDTHDSENDSRYYRWAWSETWVIKAPYASEGYPRECYKTEKSSSIVIGTSELLTDDVIRKKNLLYVSNQTNRLYYRYSIEVVQHSLSKDVYDYYKLLESVNENVGSIFDPIPVRVSGNVKCLSDPLEPVLGYFHGAGVSRKRLFIDRTELPRMFVESEYDYCSLVEEKVNPDDSDAIQAIILQMAKEGYINFFSYTEAGVLYLQFANSNTCFDCSASASAEKPSFWE